MMALLGLLVCWWMLILPVLGVARVLEALEDLEPPPPPRPRRPPPPRPRRTPRVFVWVHEPPRWSDAMVIVALMAGMAIVALLTG